MDRRKQKPRRARRTRYLDAAPRRPLLEVRPACRGGSSAGAGTRRGCEAGGALGSCRRSTASPFPILVIGSIARGTRRLNCSMRASTGRASSNSAVEYRVLWNQFPELRKDWSAPAGSSSSTGEGLSAVRVRDVPLSPCGAPPTPRMSARAAPRPRAPRHSPTGLRRAARTSVCVCVFVLRAGDCRA